MHGIERESPAACDPVRVDHRTGVDMTAMAPSAPVVTQTLSLQRAIGNCSVARLIAAGRLPGERLRPLQRAPTKETLADDPYPGTSDGEQPALISLSDDGFEFLKRHEGAVKHLYNDSQGHCTIGVGHLVHKGKCDGSEPDNFKQGLSDDDVDQLFRDDLVVFEGAVTSAITTRINQYQYDALVSFAFNIGTGAWKTSGALRQINASQWGKVPAEMLKWKKPPEIAGRRQDEADLFRTGNYGP
jgi:GH24 family phage-related lysozyme (muramidase)